jgi:hypothetical protein
MTITFFDVIFVELGTVVNVINDVVDLLLFPFVFPKLLKCYNQKKYYKKSKMMTTQKYYLKHSKDMQRTKKWLLKCRQKS